VLADAEAGGRSIHSGDQNLSRIEARTFVA